MASKLNYRTRLHLGAAALAAMTLAVAVTAWFSIRQLSNGLHLTSGPAARQLELSGAMHAGFEKLNADARAAQIALVIAMLEKGSPREGQCTACHSPDMIQQHRGHAESAAADLQAQMIELETLLASDASRSSLAELRRSLESWRSGFAAYMDLAVKPESYDQAHSIVTDRVHPAILAGEGASGRLSQAARQTLASARDSGKDSARRASVILLAVSAAAGLACIFVFMLVRRLTTRLTLVVSTIGSASAAVTQSTRKLASSSQMLSQSAVGQESAIETTSIESKGVLNSALLNNQGASEAAQAISNAETHASSAHQALEATADAMNLVRQSSLEIRGVITLIDSIAFQTNLLALNASVEAARAGESGLGFAVVAEEVRSLARRCAQAAKETSSMIEQLLARSRDGGERLERAVQALDGIEEQSRGVQSLMQKLHAGCASQSEGLARLNSALLNAGQATQQASRTADESAAEAEELAQTSTTLEECVANLTHMMGIGQR